MLCLGLVAGALFFDAAFEFPGFAPQLRAESGSRNALYYLREGDRHLAARDYRAAAHSFRLAIKKNPGHARAHLGAAGAYYEMNDLGRARSHYERVLELDASSRPARIGLGLAFVRLGQFSAAGELLRGVQKQEPGNVANNYALGLFYHLQGNLRLSEAYYKKAIRIQPSHVKALVGLARLKADQDRPDISDEYLRTARQIDPGEPDIYAARGQIELARAFLENDPAQRTRALENAHQALTTAHRLSPDDVFIEQNLVRIDLYRNRSDSALQRAEAIVQRYPRNPQLLYMMATVHLRGAGRNSAAVRKAVQRMHRALELNPGDSMVRFGLEEVVLENGNLFPATGALRRNLAAYQFERGRYYAGAQRREVAEYHIRRSLKLYPFHQPALRMELERFRRAGNYEKFIGVLRRLLRADPDNLKLRNRLERALQEKNKSLAYRAGLFHDGSVPERANFQRTPLRVFVFDMEPAAAFPAHPDGPDRVARALSFALDREGSVKAAPAALRSAVLRRVRQLSEDPSRYSYGVYYRPEYINLIEDAQRSANGIEDDITHIVSGSYRSTGEGLELRYEIIEKKTGSVAGQFRVRANGRDALPALGVQAAAQISKLLGARGRVVKVQPGNIYVNLGVVDGLRKGAQLNIRRLGTLRGVCRVAEVSSYIALCRPEPAASWDRIDPGDVVLPTR